MPTFCLGGWQSLELNHHAGPSRPAVAFDPYRIGQDTDGGAAPDGG